MCELPNGTIEYASRMSRDGAQERLLSIGAKNIGQNVFEYPVQLASQQRSQLNHMYPKHYSDLQGEVWIFVENVNVRVDGDISLYDPICGRSSPYRFCSDKQTEEQKAALRDLADRIHASIGGQ